MLLTTGKEGEAPVKTPPEVAVRGLLDELARVVSALDALPLSISDAGLLALVSQECEFYGGEVESLAVRLREASRSSWGVGEVAA